MLKNEFEVLHYIYSNDGFENQRKLADDLHLSIGLINKYIIKFENEGILSSSKKITSYGKKVLDNHKVDNAIIMAAGKSSRFVPLSYETPKGLLKVKDEIIIERQIKQLQSAGITDITIIVGYMKEKFFYLEEKFNVKIIVNSEYNIKNNVSTIKIAKDFLKNTYICSSDNFFTENPFKRYEYSAYYSSVYVDGPTNEYVISVKGNDVINKVDIGGSDSWVMMGHVYWDREFSRKFLNILEDVYEKPGYDQKLWEDVYVEFIKDLELRIKRYDENVIFEFDSLEELREFDDKFIKKTKSKIIENICKTLKCMPEEISNFKVLKGGLTNSSFIFTLNDVQYVYRHPGEGTENIIDRKSEFEALKTAKKIDIDPTFIHMDINEGWKISYYINDAVILDYNNEVHVSEAIKVIRKLHNSNEKVEKEVDFFKEALRLEILIKEKDNIRMNDFDLIKERITKIYNQVNKDNVEKVFAHADTYDPNFLYDGKKMYLIDWEYSGMSDPGADLGCFICCSPFTKEKAKELIKDYLGADYTHAMLKHFIGYVSVISFYWFVWALYKEACGDDVGSYLLMWYRYSKQYADEYENM